MLSRVFDRDLLEKGMILKKRILFLAQNFDIHDIDQASEELTSLEKGYREIAIETASYQESNIANRLADILKIAALLCCWVKTRIEAASDPQRFFTAAEDQTLLLQQSLNSSNIQLPVRRAFEKWIGDAQNIADITSLPSLIYSLGCIPLPIFCAKIHDPFEEFRANLNLDMKVEDNEKDKDKRDESIAPQKLITPIVKVLFSIDGQAWTAPQAIQSGLQYGIGVELKVSQWPSKFPILEIDFISTMDHSAYSISTFKVLEEELNERIPIRGHLVFHTPQSLLSEPAILKVRAQFTSEDRSETFLSTVIGHTELSVRALNRESYPFHTTYRTMNIQIPKILNDVKQALPELDPEDITDFTKCLIWLANYTGMVQQSGTFKGKHVDETRDFQQDLLKYLRMTELGSEVKEGERTTAGILDIRYKNIVIELKVERTTKDRKKLREKYIAQPSQYTITSIPLSITCILDMTEKVNVPSNIANNITPETPPLHGFEETAALYPSKVAVVIIDGNLKSPSDYSS